MGLGLRVISYRLRALAVRASTTGGDRPSRQQIGCDSAHATWESPCREGDRV